MFETQTHVYSEMSFFGWRELILRSLKVLQNKFHNAAIAEFFHLS